MKFFSYLTSIGTQLRQVRSLASPYFNSEKKWTARAWLSLIVALNMGSVFMLILFNEWNRVFFDALQTRDGEVFWRQMGIFVGLAVIYMAISVYKFYLTQLLSLRWRAWMTRDFLQRWLGHHTYYKLELARYTELGQAPQQLPFGNPDQRLQEDIGAFTDDTLSLTMGLVHSVATLLSFIGILWVLNDTVYWTIGGHTFAISGFMVWTAVAYAVIGSLLTHKVTYRLTGLNFAQKKYEADFRHHLIRVRESSESIALDQGENVEYQSLQGRFAAVLKNAMSILKVQRGYTWFTSGYGQAAVVFPFVVAAPRFFSGAIQLGELMQISTAFSRVQDSLSWIVDNYIRLSVWRATTDRLTGFVQRMQDCEYEKDTLIGIADTDKLELHNLNLALPSGTVLLTHPDLQVEAGDSVLITGASGSGKSTLFRAFAGIWPFAQGEISRPAGAMFIPQRAYFPIGKLRDALTYPEPASTYNDEQLQAALTEALLPYLVDQLDAEDTWGQMLSGGEQQRLAIARVLLKQPRWIFADEATNALDEPVERLLYQKLLDNVRRKGGALVSISHRPDVRFFYNKHWQFEEEPAGTSMRFHLTLHSGWSERPGD